MNCPACDGLLCQIEYEGLPIHTCPACGGEWVEGKCLRAIERRRHVEVPDHADDAVERPAREVARVCPACGVVMQKARYGKQRDIILDQCGQCRGIWLDRGELEAVQAAFEAWEDEKFPDRARQRTSPTEGAVGATFAHRLQRVSTFELIFRWVVSLVFLLGPAIAILWFQRDWLGTWQFYAIYGGAWAVMLLIAWLVEFVPDMDNIGWFGGMMDNPFSYRDDYNRTLLQLKWFFMPAEIVIGTVVKTHRYTQQ